MTIDEIRIMAMAPKQAQREKAKLEKKAALNRKKTEEIRGNDGDYSLEKESNVIAKTK